MMMYTNHRVRTTPPRFTATTLFLFWMVVVLGTSCCTYAAAQQDENGPFVSFLCRLPLFRRLRVCKKTDAPTQAPTQAPSSSPSAMSTGLNYKLVAKDIMDLVKANPPFGPTLVRLAWHSSGTYDKMVNDGGSSKGTIRFPEELAHGANAGLAQAVQSLEPIYTKYASLGLTHADLYTLCGVAAIKAMDGPSIPWQYGRVDAIDSSSVPPEGRLPNADSGPEGADTADLDHIRAIFYRMGFNDQEIVALLGAHSLGRCHVDRSGYDGPWTKAPTAFSNGYFNGLYNEEWVQRNWTGPFQYADVGGNGLMMLPADLVLIQDSEFVKWVEVYALDALKFFIDFTNAFQKLVELGTTNLTLTEWV